MEIPNSEPLTDADKIKWLWDARDRDNEKIAGLDFENGKLKEELKTLKQQYDALRLNSLTLRDERDAMAIELNEARAAAARSVEEYRANTKG